LMFFNNIENDGFLKKDYGDIFADSNKWEANNQFFKFCKISSFALHKMMLSAFQSEKEKMGILTGTVETNSFIIFDAYLLPVEGTETRVNAGEDADAYRIRIMDLLSHFKTDERIIGWWHSHPGLHPFLSGIDIETQKLQQQAEPSVAIVIDHLSSVESEKVEIGAYRTLPRGHTFDPADYQKVYGMTNNDELVKTFGTRFDEYYPLQVSVFKTDLEKKSLNSFEKLFWSSNILPSTAVKSNEVISKNADSITELIKNDESDSKKSSKSYEAIRKLSTQMLQCSVNSIFNIHESVPVFNLNEKETYGKEFIDSNVLEKTITDSK